MSNPIKNYPITSFFLLTLFWSASVWVFLLPVVQHYFSAKVPDWFFWLGEIAPGGSAIIVTLLTKGGAGLKSLLKPILKWKVHPIHYYVVIIAITYFYLAATGLSAMLGLTVPTISATFTKLSYTFLNLPALLLFPVFVIIYIFCEELGWRGFALREGMKKYSLFKITLIVGVVWSIFHLPLMLQHYEKITASYVLFYFLTTIFDSFLFSWVYVSTGGSLLLVGILHGAMNFYGAFSPAIISNVGQGENLHAAVLHIVILLPFVVWAFFYGKPPILNKQGERNGV